MTRLSNPLRSLLMGACLIVALPAAESAAPPMTAEDDSPSARASDAEWTFQPPIKRRDVFYDLESVMEARREMAAELAKRKEQQMDDDGAEELVQVDTADEAIAQAQMLLQRTQEAIFNKRWSDAMRTADTGIALLTRLDVENADRERVKDLLDKLTRFRVQAEDAKLYEEARAEFNALGLEVEGIMWSADQPSSAIISGEPRRVQDQVKNSLIVNIDTNRVDFMYTYKTRHYEFQRYIGEGK